MKHISFDTNACRDVSRAVQNEWREKNESGGFSSSTILAANTRRTHGLLVPRLERPLGNCVLLSALDEVLHVEDVAYPLSTRFYANSIFPEGYQYLSQFSIDPFPTWFFRVEDLVLEKNVIFLSMEQTVLVRYQVISGDELFVRLELKPMTAFRHIKELGHYNERISTEVKASQGKVEYAGCYFYHNAAIVDQTGSWFRDIHYPREQEAGRDFTEDLYAPFRLMYAFGEGRENFFCASVTDKPKIRFPELLIREAEHRGVTL